MSDEDEQPAVYVCDFDDAVTRVDLAGQDYPFNNVYLDGEIDLKSGKIDLSCQGMPSTQPTGLFQSSVPTDLEQLFKYTEALCSLNDYADEAFQEDALSLLFTRTPYHEGERLVYTTQTVFEYLRPPSFLPLLSTQAIMYGSGRPQGVAIDSRNSTTHAAVVVDGLPTSVSPVLNLGSLGLTQMLAKNLEGRISEALMNSVIENPGIHSDIKHICGTQLYVAPDLDQERSSGPNTGSYRLIDGQVIKAKNEMFDVPEALFRPELAAVSGEGVDQMVCNVVESAGGDKKELLQNIVIGGENAYFKGTAARLQAEITAKTGITSSVTQTGSTSSTTGYSAWTGGSIIASMSVFDRFAASIDEYGEFGSSLVERKGW